MHRIDAADNLAGQFTDGVPGTTPATVIDAAWLNDAQENLCQAVEAAGITLVKGTGTQLRDAILALAAAPVQSYTDATGFTLGNCTWSSGTITLSRDGIATANVILHMTGTIAPSTPFVTMPTAIYARDTIWFDAVMFDTSGSTWSTIKLGLNAGGSLESFESSALPATAQVCLCVSWRVAP